MTVGENIRLGAYRPVRPSKLAFVYETFPILGGLKTRRAADRQADNSKSWRWAGLMQAQIALLDEPTWG